MYLRLMKEIPFKADDYQKTLRELTITENSPGTLLHDFNVILQQVVVKKLTLTPQHRLQLKTIKEINARLKRPIQTGLKRLTQTSNPLVTGLYLILRASGLTYIDETGKKPTLVLDKDIYNQWLKLNPTEQYFYLLESWLLRGYGELVGERSLHRWLGPTHFDKIAGFLLHKHTRPPLQVNGEKQIIENLKYWPGWHTLGILYMTGILDIESADPQPGQAWNIQKISISDTGKAILLCLIQEFFIELPDIVLDWKMDETPTPLYRILKPYFPEWKTPIQFKLPDFQGDDRIFKVSLDPSTWRRIAINPAQTLDHVASTILQAFDFEDEHHLYQFNFPNRFGITQSIEHPYMEMKPDTSEIRIGQIPLHIGQTMTFIFDFGDDWQFKMLLEDIKTDEPVETSKILEQKGEAPPQYISPGDDFIIYLDDDFDDDSF